MKERFKKLQEYCKTKMRGYDLLVEIEAEANMVFMLMLKFSVMPDRTIMERAVKYLGYMREMERQWFEIVKLKYGC